ncbi:MAG: NifB/NifX family molybdenum-iron cluster-binding protein [Kiritimatiellia bacterium]
MKIAFTTDGVDLTGEIDTRFGRAPKFLIFDTKSRAFEVVDNTQNLNAAQGAGIQSAETIVKLGANAVVTGHCGPKAYRALNAAGVKIYNTEIKNIEVALQAVESGALTPAADADVEGHW